MTKKIYSMGKWIDENGNEIIEPKSKYSLGCVPSFGIKDRSNEIGREIGAEIDAHNSRIEQIERDRDNEKLENVTKSFLKQNNLL